MSIKKTLLEIVKGILNDMDSEDINSLSDTVEAQQIASVVESVYYDIISTRDIPEHKELIKLTSLSDSTRPTHFTLGDNVKHIDELFYDKSTDGSLEYRRVYWCDPLEFLTRLDMVTENYTSVFDVNANTTLRIRNNQHPSFFSSFDDKTIVMNSYDSSLESTLQSSKTRAIGTVFPTFNKSDDNYVPDLDSVLFPYLIREATSMSFSLFKGGVDQKVEQAARRQKAYIQNDMYRVGTRNRMPNYGR